MAQSLDNGVIKPAPVTDGSDKAAKPGKLAADNDPFAAISNQAWKDIEKNLDTFKSDVIKKVDPGFLQPNDLKVPPGFGPPAERKSPQTEQLPPVDHPRKTGQAAPPPAERQIEPPTRVAPKLARPQLSPEELFSPKTESPKFPESVPPLIWPVEPPGRREAQRPVAPALPEGRQRPVEPPLPREAEKWVAPKVPPRVEPPRSPWGEAEAAHGVSAANGDVVKKLTGLGSDRFANVYAISGMQNRSDRHLDHSGQHPGQEGPDLIMHVNKNFDPNKPADVVIVNHGWYTSAGEFYAQFDGKSGYIKNFSVGAQLENANPQTIVVLPAWQPTEDSKDSSDGKLAGSGRYGKMISEGLAALSDQAGLSRVENGTKRALTIDDVRDVGIISHSAGYAPTVTELNDPALRAKVKFVGMLDSLYGSGRTGFNAHNPDTGGNVFRDGVNAFIERNSKNGAFMNGSAGYLNVYGDNDNKIVGSSTAQMRELWPKGSRYLEFSDQPKTANPNVIGVRPITVIHTGEPHSNIPKLYLKKAIEAFDNLQK